MARYSKKRRKTKSRISLILCIFALCAVLVAGVFGIKSLLPAESSTTDSTSSVTDDSASQPKEEEFVDDGKIHSNVMMFELMDTMMSVDVQENNLAKFIEYIKNENGGDFDG